MKKRPIIIFLILILAAAAAIAFLNLRRHAAPGGIAAPAGAGAPSAAVATGTPFASSPYAAHAYLISATGTWNAATLAALSGFSVQRQTLADGTMNVTVSSVSPAGGTETYSVKPGEHLYFIENFPMDDAAGADRFLGDDRVILVGADGMIQ